MSIRLNRKSVAIQRILAFALVATLLAPAIRADDDEPLGHDYTRRGDHIFYKGQRIDEAGKHDIAKFARAVGHRLTLCRDVDAKSFKALSVEYTKDKNKVYYKWISPGRIWVVVLPKADPKTFEVLGFNLAKDAKHVWRWDSLVPNVDAASAVIVHPRWAWKDRHRVYYHGTGKVFPDADPKTFRHLDHVFFRDAKRVYWSDSVLKGADPATFKTFGDVPYAVDKNHVWAGSKILEHVDAASFELLHNGVYRDLSGVFVGGKRLLNIVDAPSFKKVAVLSDGHSVLFKDRFRHFVYEPSYSGVYTLEAKGDSIFISKPIWLRQTPKKAPAHGATVSITLKGGVFSLPNMVMQPKFLEIRPPEYEMHMIKIMKPVFIEAQKRINKK